MYSQDFEESVSYYQLSFENLKSIDSLFSNKVCSSLGLIYENEKKIQKQKKTIKWQKNTIKRQKNAIKWH